MELVSFLPGPVALAPAVRAALAEEPLSHRSDAFREVLARVTARLSRLTAAEHVAVMSGPGTLANDMVAAQLSLRPGPGLVLANGEFGERLIDHARRFGLDHEVHVIPWGASFDLTNVTRIVDEMRPAWVWATHCETSTGVLNDLDGLRAMAQGSGALLCLDCISTIGTVAVDLEGVHLASGTSGKGLGACAGLALVFTDRIAQPHPRLPRSLDLGYHLACDGVPFTLPSPLLVALDRALDTFDGPAPWDDWARRGADLRARLARLGYQALAPERASSPAVLTIPLGPDQPAGELGHWLAEAGYLVGYQSSYLRERNWLQICLMGDVRQPQIDAMLRSLARYRSALTA